MTDCTPPATSSAPVRLSKVQRRDVLTDFDGGRLTSDAGLLLLREVDQQIGLLDAINAAIPDPRHPLYIIHEQRELLAQRIYAIAAGYEDGNDHDALRHDPTLQTVAGREPDEEKPLASPATLCRLENRITRATIWRLHKVLIDQYLQAYDGPPESIILDLDATDDTLHGDQEGRFYHGYYRGYCYLPLYVFADEHPLVSYLRPSNIDGAKHSRAVVKLLVGAIRQYWPDVKITIRGDSGFCRWKLLRWCDNHDVTYVVGLARNSVLEADLEPVIRQVEIYREVTGINHRRFHEFRYAAGTWDRERRVIGKAELTGKGRNPRFIVTNDEETSARELYETVYCARGEMENHIKEQQLSLFADRTSCSSLLGNQFRMLLSAFASVLYENFRRRALHDTKFERAEASTVRTRLIKVAARVTMSVRRVVFHLSSHHPCERLFRLALTRLGIPAATPLLDTG